MKEIEKKQLPGISGGQVGTTFQIEPTTCIPITSYPQVPGGPIDPIDPLGDGTKKQLQS